MLELVLMVIAAGAIFGTFLAAAEFHKRGKEALATASPFFVFLPIALICLGQAQKITVADAAAIIGFAGELSFVFWLCQRRE